MSCAAESQALVRDLVDLLERTGMGSGVGWGGRCMTPRGRGRGCCTERERGRTEIQMLYEVLLRVARRGKYVNSGGRRAQAAGCLGARGRDTGLSRVVKQLLDELESVAGCLCYSCCDYVEINTRRVRNALREVDGRGGGGGGGFLADHADAGAGCGCGCSGSTETVTKVICERPVRRARSGNVHLGWSLR